MPSFFYAIFHLEQANHCLSDEDLNTLFDKLGHNNNNIELSLGSFPQEHSTNRK